MSDARTKLRAFAPAFLEVIEELERKIKLLEVEVGHRAEKTIPLPADVRVLSDRITTLESSTRELHARCQEVAGAALTALQDRDRQDRWHATSNAALTGLLAWQVLPVHACETNAREIADRAHGPLEMPVELKPSDAAYLTDQHAESHNAAARELYERMQRENAGVPIYQVDLVGTRVETKDKT